MPVDATVIIPVLNGAATLPAQLEALKAQNFSGTIEVVVADNGSTDSTAADARAVAGLLHLRLVDASDLRGASHARNVGAASAQGKALLFCDADDMVSENWCTGLTDGLRNADAVGGGVDFARLNPDLPGITGDNPLLRRLDEWPGYLPFAWASNLGVRRDVFKGIGGFHESFAGTEDLEFSWRLQQQGFRLAFAPNAVVHMRVRSRTPDRLRQAFRYAMDEPHLYRVQRGSGMPDSVPLRLWLGSLAKRYMGWLRHPSEAGRRQIALDSSARFFGLVRGSLKYRTWFLGPR